MRSDGFDRSRLYLENETAALRHAIGRSCVWTVSQKPLALIFLCAIILPWFSILEPLGESAPMLLARGLPGVQTPVFSFAPDGETIATIDSEGRVALRGLTNGSSITRFLHYKGFAWSAAFSPNGHLLAVGGTTPDIIMYDIRSDDAGHPLGMSIRRVKGLVFSPDGRILAATSSLCNGVLLWDLAEGRERMSLLGHASPVSSLAFAPDGSWLASGGQADGMIIVWDIATGRPRWLHRGKPGPIMSLASSPDGTRLASVNSYEHSVQLWDLRAGRLDRLIATHSTAPNAVSFAPDGRMLVIAGEDGGLGLWDVATGQQLARLGAKIGPLRSVRFSPDGRTLAATGYDNDVRLWKAADLPQVETRPWATAGSKSAE
jgi:WD40 repeat protein